VLCNVQIVLGEHQQPKRGEHCRGQ